MFLTEMKRGWGCTCSTQWEPCNIISNPTWECELSVYTYALGTKAAKPSISHILWILWIQVDTGIGKNVYVESNHYLSRQTFVCPKYLTCISKWNSINTCQVIILIHELSVKSLSLWKLTFMPFDVKSKFTKSLSLQEFLLN